MIVTKILKLNLMLMELLLAMLLVVLVSVLIQLGFKVYDSYSMTRTHFFTRFNWTNYLIGTLNSQITEPLGCSAQPSGHCNGWCGIALKLSADLQTTVWRTVFRDVTGGVGDYAPATPLGPSMVFTECWSISKESFFYRG